MMLMVVDESVAFCCLPEMSNQFCSDGRRKKKSKVQIYSLVVFMNKLFSKLNCFNYVTQIHFSTPEPTNYNSKNCWVLLSELRVLLFVITNQFLSVGKYVDCLNTKHSCADCVGEMQLYGVLAHVSQISI